MDGLKEFLESSTIHGLIYIATNRRVARLLWIWVVFAGFTGAGVLIYQSFSSWEESPVSTTIETRSISDLEFPGVVVCPAKNSFTTLNPDLIRANKNSWDGNTTRRLQEILIEATFDSHVEKKYKTMTSFFEKDKFFNWYKGESKLLYGTIFGQTRKYFYPETSALSGRFSTPHFGEIFHEEDFVKDLKFHISIYVPAEIRKNGSISLVIDIDYDIEHGKDAISRKTELLSVYASNNKKIDLNASQKKYKKAFSLQGADYYRVEHTRRIPPSWKSKRHTGMRVSWYYNDTVQPDQKYLSDNQDFISLVNAVYENRTGLREELMRKRQEVLTDDPWCLTGSLYRLHRSRIKLPSLGNVSAEPVYINKVTQETLATAGKLYFYFRKEFIQISKLTVFNLSTDQYP